MTNIKERVLQIARLKGIPYELFCSKLGMTYGNFKGKAKNTPLNSDALAKILSNYRDVDAEWLILGIGDIFKNTGANWGTINTQTNNTGVTNKQNNENITILNRMQDLNSARELEEILSRAGIKLPPQEFSTLEIYRVLDVLHIKMESLERELSSKDNIINSLIKALATEREK